MWSAAVVVDVTIGLHNKSMSPANQLCLSIIDLWSSINNGTPWLWGWHEGQTVITINDRNKLIFKGCIRIADQSSQQGILCIRSTKGHEGALPLWCHIPHIVSFLHDQPWIEPWTKSMSNMRRIYGILVFDNEAVGAGVTELHEMPIIDYNLVIPTESESLSNTTTTYVLTFITHVEFCCVSYVLFDTYV